MKRFLDCPQLLWACHKQDWVFCLSALCFFTSFIWKTDMLASDWLGGSMQVQYTNSFTVAWGNLARYLLDVCLLNLFMSSCFTGKFQQVLIAYSPSSGWEGTETPSMLACQLVLTSFMSPLENHIVGSTWVELPCDKWKTQSHRRCPGL